MIGAIIGDIIGSVYEGYPIKKEDFVLFQDSSSFTDDTVMTIATAEAILNKGDYGEYYQKWGRKYPNAGYGANFYNWLTADTIKGKYPAPYNSWGNGAAMRVGPIGFAFDSLKEVEHEALLSASVSHNHTEGIKGAQAVAAAIYLARKNSSKIEIRDYLEQTYNYNITRNFQDIRKDYSFEVSAAGSVPEAIMAFLESINFEDAIRKAVSLGGDSDTQACIAGVIAEAFYKEVPEGIERNARLRLTAEMEKVLESFNQYSKTF